MVLALTLTACSNPGASIGPIDHPTGNGLILRMSYSGGFAGPTFDFLNFPPFSLIGDGRVIVPGPQVGLYPGPALPAVNVRRLTEAGIQAVLRETSRTVLFGSSIQLRGAQDCVMDASDTIFTLDADGHVVTVTVYGLGTMDPANACRGISSAELAAHRTLQKLSDRLTNLEAWLPAGAWADPTWRPFQAAALRLVARNSDADPPDGSGIDNPLLDWPKGSDPTTFGQPGPFAEQRCGVVSGQVAQDWYALLSSANQLTRFVKDGHRYQVTVRLMLPDEPLECPRLPA